MDVVLEVLLELLGDGDFLKGSLLGRTWWRQMSAFSLQSEAI